MSGNYTGVPGGVILAIKVKPILVTSVTPATKPEATVYVKTVLVTALIYIVITS